MQDIKMLVFALACLIGAIVLIIVTEGNQEAVSLLFATALGAMGINQMQTAKKVGEAKKEEEK